MIQRLELIREKQDAQEDVMEIMVMEQVIMEEVIVIIQGKFKIPMEPGVRLLLKQKLTLLKLLGLIQLLELQLGQQDILIQLELGLLLVLLLL